MDCIERYYPRAPFRPSAVNNTNTFQYVSHMTTALGRETIVMFVKLQPYNTFSQ
jgi:hypothetical protein